MNFKDEVFVNGKKIIEIPIENIYYEHQDIQVKTKFSDPPRKQKIKKQNKDIKFTPDGINKGDLIFNPLKAITQEKQQQLAIEYNKKFPQQIENKNKKSKWGEEWEKQFNPPPLDIINQELNLQEIEYLLRLYRLDDLNRKYKDNILEIPDNDIRSPEPEFLYNKQGKRINTLNQRIANEMYLEKNYLIEDCRKMDFNFMTPFDWKEKKKTRKIFIPEYENTTIDFTQILLGPGGRTQRILEQLSNCRIQIRGKNFNRKQQRRQNEQTHVLVQADTEEDLEIGVDMVQKILKGDTLQDVASTQNKFLKTGHELIAIETVLRDFCENCKEEGHKIWSCPYMTIKNVKKNIDLNSLIKCELCGGKSHIKKDCPKFKYIQESDDMDVHYDHYKLLKDEQLEDPEIIEIKEGETTKAITNFITDQKEQPIKMIKDKKDSNQLCNLLNVFFFKFKIQNNAKNNFIYKLFFNTIIIKQNQLSFNGVSIKSYQCFK